MLREELEKYMQNECAEEWTVREANNSLYFKFMGELMFKIYKEDSDWYVDAVNTDIEMLAAINNILKKEEKHSDPPMWSTTQEKLESLDPYAESMEKFFAEIRSAGDPAEEEKVDWNKEYERTKKILSKHKTDELIAEPKEEEQKIEKLEFETVPAQWDGRDSSKMWHKINELVDAMNKLRGVK